jgi:hypothetical protein
MANVGEMNANSFADMQDAPWKHHIFSHSPTETPNQIPHRNLGYIPYNIHKLPHKILMKIFPAFCEE